MILSLAIFCIASATAFVQNHQTFVPSTFVLHAKKSGEGEIVQQHAFAVGSFVEFEEKKRVHVGKIERVEHKGNGGARYDVIDADGKKYGIADKSIRYSMSCPNSPGQAQKLYSDFCASQDSPLQTLEEKLEITPDLLEMVWEEYVDEDQSSSKTITAGSLVDVVHSHAASSIETYLAWQLLKTDLAHVFFKEIKDHGRVVAFKAKTKKAVDAAKDAFCRTHVDSEICFV
mmetsp:Transcript_41289/g.96823  ORF Transcript_41289/g.96823 Transcript_41289/m.96823 type:complete len:230 (-) Transcript_41289:141-830(-)|eukprot:CAMPEP_0113297260 /NCGR_PEP_ID=MMETSP0010_2-20120614/199_1 /TAXON_ID=216773 ORGANISM="Corethron hystrix, Strain 308" /NCGR_SAMPLE_ID=MMETSP0010_2 /ASSEMBLY_ACC=CAM_ASM_000155 /LENGTH=229 /DNA_ID=CAMNT_0000150125 /DNA_START=213 /DNA_END=902 /DNA_ORIENTATION=- /assembly_acc=CAM_ASM_000155